MNIRTACYLARLYARRSIAAAVQLLLDVGLTLNAATRYVLAAARAQRFA